MNLADLTKLKAQVKKVFGKKAANKEVVAQVQNLIAALEKQEPSPRSPLSASACLGSGSGNSVITDTPDPDTLIGTSGKNRVSGLGGDDRINGCAGDIWCNS